MPMGSRISAIPPNSYFSPFRSCEDALPDGELSISDIMVAPPPNSLIIEYFPPIDIQFNPPARFQVRNRFFWNVDAHS